MAERGPDSESYLAEIDRRLREIQAEFAPSGRTAVPGRAAERAIPGRAAERDPTARPVRRASDAPAPGGGRGGPLEAVLRRTRFRAAAPPPSPPPSPPARAPGDEPGSAPEPPEVGEAEPRAAASAPVSAAAPTVLQARLMAAIDELLQAYEHAAAATPASPEELMVSAGPFAGIAELRDFQRALSEIPGVLGVSVRGYEGTDRALIEVCLGGAVT